MINHQAFMQVPSARDGLRWWLLGRDRRHPLVWLVLGLVAIGLVAFVVMFWPYVVLGLLAGGGAGELARRHDVPGWAWPVALAIAVLFAAIFAPTLAISAGALVGARIGSRRPIALASVSSIERPELG